MLGVWKLRLRSGRKRDERSVHELPARLPVAKRPDGAMLLYHLSQQHPDEIGPYLDCIRTEAIGTAAAEAYAVVED